VFIFYTSDWDDDSYSLLSSFSSLSKQFSSSDCYVYGCSTDCVGSHIDMIKTRFGSSLPFPLLSDPSGKLASRFSLFDREERINMRSVVTTDNQGIALEVINTSMEDEQMAEYALGLVKQTLQHRSRLLHKRCHFEQVDKQ
jgi:alkyl hydroperoxide reductase subunit AhpC